MKKKRKITKIINKIIPYLFLAISNIVICVIYYITKVLKEVNFYEIVYTFTNNLEGTGSGMVTDGIMTCILIFIILMIVLIIPITNSKKIEMYFEVKNKRINIYPNFFSRHKIIYSIIILIISILLLAKTINFDDYIINMNTKSDIYENYYVDTKKPKIKFHEKKNNLILIYLESMESSLFSIDNGGTFEVSRIPELEELALENLNFSNTDLLGGAYNLTSTGWTASAAVATSSGTPLLTKINNNYDKLNKFLPTVRTLGDVLKKEGYNLELIQGTTIKFAGMDKFYSQHGEFKFLDYDEAKRQKLISEDYYTWWGYEDKKLFKFAKKELLALSEEDEPFALLMYTMDTHFKDGYLDNICEENFDDQLSNVYACSSKMVVNFVNWIKEQEFYEDTTIVIIGDHAAMQNEYYNDYKGYTRTIYNTFINSLAKPKNSKNRHFSSLDMYPTILASIGAEIEGNQLGFGVNLFSNKETLIEKLGKQEFSNELLKDSKYYNKKILIESIEDKIDENMVKNDDKEEGDKE